ncbi:hypothetical protein E0F15_00170 [Frankia sp. B2]|nr:hypothetical protein E0F15_00170 [Frankia sp. B2]
MHPRKILQWPAGELHVADHIPAVVTGHRRDRVLTGGAVPAVGTGGPFDHEHTDDIVGQLQGIRPGNQPAFPTAINHRLAIDRVRAGRGGRRRATGGSRRNRRRALAAAIAAQECIAADRKQREDQRNGQRTDPILTKPGEAILAGEVLALRLIPGIPLFPQPHRAGITSVGPPPGPGMAADPGALLMPASMSTAPGAGSARATGPVRGATPALAGARRTPLTRSRRS